MADLGRAMISKIVHDNDLFSAVRSGVRPNWFEDTEHRKVYLWVLEYSTRYGETPTENALKTEFPNYRLLSVPEPYDYYTDQFRLQRERSILVDAVIAADDALKDGDQKLARTGLSKGLLRLGTEVTSLTDENAVGFMKTRYEAYEEARKHAGELSGVATGFPKLDYISGGYHPQQFILIGGAPKQGKSFMLMRSAIAAHDQGNKVLFISFEMSRFEQLARYDAITCQVNASHIIRSSESDLEMKKIKRGMSLRKNMEPFIVSADISATTTISGLAGKIEEHQPDIVFVDGVYLMENEIGAETGSSQAYTSISRGLKRTAQRIGVPIVGTTQALTGKMSKDGAVTMHSLGWTSAWAQDSDLILGAERLPDLPSICLRVVAGRNVSPCEINVSCDWDHSTFEEVELDEDD